MLKNILSPEDCAACRVCCVFDKYGLWDTPPVDGALREKILDRYPGIAFVRKGGEWLFRMEAVEDGRYRCPMLTERGCALGDEKPFVCRIWPYRVMELGGARVISIASVCPVMYAKPLSELCGVLEDGLAERIAAYADACPEAIKPYEQGYPILKVLR